MDERFKLAGFIVILFLGIFSADFLDEALKSLTAENEWWYLVVGMPFLMVLVGTGFLLYRIKSLIKFAFFGAICFLIFIATQIYYFPEETREEWNVLKQGWTEIGIYFGLMFASVFLSILIVLCAGGFFRYLYNLFFAASKSEISE